MKAVQYSEFGGPEVLKIVDLPDPHPAPGQIRVSVRAVGINPIDWKLRRGGPMGGELPQTTGRDVAGGARVIGTASPGNHDYLRSLGAEPTTSAKDWWSESGRSRPTASAPRSTLAAVGRCPRW